MCVTMHQSKLMAKFSHDSYLFQFWFSVPAFMYHKLAMNWYIKHILKIQYCITKHVTFYD